MNLEEWLDKYGESHQNKKNILIHKVCVPAIMFSLLGLVWSIPWPFSDYGMPFINWTLVLLVPALLFYFSLSLKVALAMLVFSMIQLLGVFYLNKITPLWQTCLVMFVIAWIGQFVGHKIEGKKPSFFEDLQFLLIGPIWVFYSLNRR